MKTASLKAARMVPRTIYLITITVAIILILTQLSESARKMGGRRKSSRKQKQSTRLIALSPKLKAYYDNENVSHKFPSLSNDLITFPILY